MMISGITAYTPIRQAQKVNFGEISTSSWLRRTCGLSDEDMSMLNDRCPKELNVVVLDTPADDSVKQRVRAYITYKDEKKPSISFDVFINNNHSYSTKQENKQTFMDCVNAILDKYNKQ